MVFSKSLKSEPNFTTKTILVRSSSQTKLDTSKTRADNFQYAKEQEIKTANVGEQEQTQSKQKNLSKATRISPETKGDNSIQDTKMSEKTNHMDPINANNKVQSLVQNQIKYQSTPLSTEQVETCTNQPDATETHKDSTMKQEETKP